MRKKHKLIVLFILFGGLIFLLSKAMLPNKKSPTAVLTPKTTPQKTLLETGFVPTVPFALLDNFELTMFSLGQNQEKQNATKQDLDKQFSEKQLKIVPITSLRGKPLILHFWATWCQPCLLEMPNYNLFAKNSPVDNIAICVDKSPPAAVYQFCQQRGLINLKLAVDNRGIVESKLKVTALPTTIFINAKGEEVGRIVGAVDWQDAATTTLLTNNLLGK